MKSSPYTVPRKPLPHAVPTHIRSRPTAQKIAPSAYQVLPVDDIGQNEDAYSTLMSRAKGREITSTRSSMLWWFELVCAIVSLLAILAIVIVLRVYDGHPLSTWNLRLKVKDNSLSVSPNFVVALLSTLSKSTLAVAVSAALSQAKWNWFARQERPLEDFRCFDYASRGPMGSLELLWKTRARRLASVGALITIMTLSFDPFLQLLISYPGQAFSRQDAGVQLARAEIFDKGERSNYPLDHNNIGKVMTSPADVMVAAVNNALWSATSRQNPQYRCDKGNCTWEPYVSLSVCNSCFNVSQMLNHTTYFNPAPKGNPTCSSNSYYGKASLEPYKNMSTVNFRDYANGCGMTLQISTTSVPYNTISFRESQTLLFSTIMIHSAPSYIANKTKWEDTPVEAIECGLTVCAVTYSASVVNGKYQEEILESTSIKKPESWIPDTTGMRFPSNGTMKRASVSQLGPGLPLGSLNWNPIYIGDQYSPPRTDFELELSPAQKQISRKQTFRLTQNAIESTAKFLADLFQQSGSVAQTAGIKVYSSTTMRALYSASSLDVFFQNMALDMSAAMRTLGSSFIEGYANDWTIVIAIRWPFVLVPALLSFLGLVYLFSTMFQTHRAGMVPWKENPLAGLIYGLDNETRSHLRESHSLHELEKAGKAFVHLESSLKGPELVSRNFKPSPDWSSSETRIDEGVVK